MRGRLRCLGLQPEVWPEAGGRNFPLADFCTKVYLGLWHGSGVEPEAISSQMPHRAVSRGTCRMRTLELRIPPLALVLIFVTAMAAIAWTVPASMAIAGRLIIAGAFALVGAAVALAGVIAFRRHNTTVNPLTPEQSSTLVASGIYRFSRNPMYLGFLLALLGWGVYLSNWACVLLLPVFVAYMNRFQIQPEERALTDLFGPQFVAYAKSVRRWF